ncbi:MAG: DUF1697 domain-containing protein [Luteimonas sp.]|nr:DUF1697 domain-containing protein [Luteimonas sp.]
MATASLPLRRHQTGGATTRIALFRGINVGKAKRIAMADLRLLFEALGYGNVRTLLNSGNVVFESRRKDPQADAGHIASAVAEHTGISANTLVLDATALDRIAEANPYTSEAGDPSRLLVGFFIAAGDLAPFEAMREAFPGERFALGPEACYLWCPEGILESRIGSLLAGAKFRDRVTTRNWATVLKLQAMARA